MYEGLKVIGLSHDSSPIAIRESVAFSENENRIFLDRMREMLGVEEALILSPCNRTEIYYTSDLDLSNGILILVSKLIFSNTINVVSFNSGNTSFTNGNMYKSSFSILDSMYSV